MPATVHPRRRLAAQQHKTYEGIAVCPGNCRRMEKEYQHIIPQGYLKAWCPPDPPPGRAGQVWVVQKANPEDKVLRSPKNHFGRENQYTDRKSTRLNSS